MGQVLGEVVSTQQREDTGVLYILVASVQSQLVN